MEKGMYIGGEWLQAEGGRTFAVTNPSTGETVGVVADAGAEDARRAVDAAHGALSAWADLTGRERGAFLQKVWNLMRQKRDDLARLMSEEMGKPFGEAKGEIAYAMEFVAWYAEEAKRVYGETIPATFGNQRLMVIKRPVGVVAAITPWNFPAAMVTRKIAPALAAGCTVILKPAEQTPLTAAAMFEIFHEAGLPAGVVNLVTTSNPAAVAEVFLKDDRVRKLGFTGSTEVGKLLMRGCADGLKKISLELGGHAPFIIFPDADIAKAAKDAALAKFMNAGQACVCVNRIYVHESVAQEFTDAFVARVKKLRVGPGLAEGTNVGPLIEPAALEKVHSHVEDAVRLGATLLCGGSRLTEGDLARGNFYAPTVLGGVTGEMRIHNEETFGPVAPVLTFSDENEVLERANASRYGLAAYVYTRDIGRMFKMAEKLEYGLIGVNEPFPGSAQAPFGGMKESGMGREGGRQGIEEFLETKTISIQI